MSILYKVISSASVAILVYASVPSAMRLQIPAETVHVLESFLEVVGGIYSVLAAFVIFVVWEQFNALEKSTVQEGNLAAEVPRLAAQLGPSRTDLRRKIASATRAYLDAGIAEWEDLAKCQESHKSIEALDALEARVTEVGALGGETALVYGRMLDAVEALRACRAARVAVARHRMPDTLCYLLLLLSLLLLAAFLALPPGHPLIGLGTFAGMAGVLAMIQAVVRDLDNPFVGVWNVSKAPFEEPAKALPR